MLFNRLTKFRKLVSSYREQGYGILKSIFYSCRLLYKRYLLESYAKENMVREKEFLFVKAVVGGTVEIIPFRVKSGPKPILEYAYFDGVRKDDLFKLLSGPNRDFNGLIDVLFLFAEEVRYKFMNKDEVTIKSDREYIPSEELEKKILSISLPYN